MTAAAGDPGYRILDAGTRTFWRTVGRRVDLDGEHAWLRAPAADTGAIGESWLDAAAASVAGSVGRGEGGGLVPELAALDGPGFAADSLDPAVRPFYEHTDEWTMDAWSSWSPVFQPGGLLIEHLFGRRLQQLALPIQPLDVSHGIDSEIVAIRDAVGQQVWAAWLRRLRRSGQFLFSGAYAVRALPGAARPSVHVTFPLEHTATFKCSCGPRSGRTARSFSRRRAGLSEVTAPTSSCMGTELVKAARPGRRRCRFTRSSSSSLRTGGTCGPIMNSRSVRLGHSVCTTECGVGRWTGRPLT